MGTADRTPPLPRRPPSHTLGSHLAWPGPTRHQDLPGTSVHICLPVTRSEEWVRNLCWVPRVPENVCGSWFCLSVPYVASCCSVHMPGVFGLVPSLPDGAQSLSTCWAPSHSGASFGDPAIPPPAVSRACHPRQSPGWPTQAGDREAHGERAWVVAPAHLLPGPKASEVGITGWGAWTS